jgi:hypothetical protein
VTPRLFRWKTSFQLNHPHPTPQTLSDAVRGTTTAFLFADLYDHFPESSNHSSPNHPSAEKKEEKKFEAGIFNHKTEAMLRFSLLFTGYVLFTETTADCDQT